MYLDFSVDVLKSSNNRLLIPRAERFIFTACASTFDIYVYPTFFLSVSYKIRLTTEQSYQLADKMNETSSKKLSRRLLAISLRHYGYPIGEIALLVGVSEKTITTWIKSFLAGGFDELLQLNYVKRRNSKLAPYEDEILAYQESNPQARLEDLQQWLKETHEIEVEYSWLYRYLDRHGLWKKDSPV